MMDQTLNNFYGSWRKMLKILMLSMKTEIMHYTSQFSEARWRLIIIVLLFQSEDYDFNSCYFFLGYINVAQFLHDHGKVNVNHVNNHGNSSLLIAVQEGKLPLLCIIQTIFNHSFTTLLKMLTRSIGKCKIFAQYGSGFEYGVWQWENCIALCCVGRKRIHPVEFAQFWFKQRCPRQILLHSINAFRSTWYFQPFTENQL